MITPSVRGWLRPALVALLALISLRAADEPAAGSVVELPKFEVKDSRLLPQPEKWLYAEIPNFEILSSISSRQTKRFVQDFLLLQEVIEVIMPGLARANSPVPTALILCGRGKGFDEFVPAERSEQRYGTNTLFFQTPERSGIVVDFALAELQLDAATSEESDPYRGFYIEYFRFLLRRQLNGSAPPWFEEGLVQIFAATEFNRKWITFAQIGDGFGGEKTGDFNRRLSQRALIPLRDFLESSDQKDRDHIWSAQCYAFVHLCLYGWNQKYTKPFVKYLMRISREEPTEEIFKECFGQTYKQMALVLRGYVDFTNYKAMQFTAKKGQELPSPPDITPVDAPDAVVGRIKGEMLRLAGHGDEARNTLIAPYVRGERDPRLLAALGLDEQAAGQSDRARRFLEAAIAAKIDRSRAYLELGRIRLESALVSPSGRDGKLDDKQLQAVLDPLFGARTRPPRMAETYALIADAWAAAATRMERDHFAVVVEGVKFFPRNTGLVMKAALLATARGFDDTARDLIKLGRRVSKTDAERDRFALMEAAMGPETAEAKPNPAPKPQVQKVPEPFK